MDMLTLLFDVLIAILSIWVLMKLTGYGGVIGEALTMVGYGIIVIGLSQFIETIGLYFLSSDMSVVGVIHFVHRLVLLTGMFLIFFGFRKLLDK